MRNGLGTLRRSEAVRFTQRTQRTAEGQRTAFSETDGVRFLFFRYGLRALLKESDPIAPGLGAFCTESDPEKEPDF